ncbi:hypothetical protein CDL15_Pgr014801 [Punica granatum]|uniref:Sugar phosphate transporter domain-containing protein n=1 Tax=Punica granatum TaxID=22663 RepID=A0A218Y0A5_PUNGR|nr:hypothetical protein CDL15_Pgr014801 [Punica granatum]
MQSSAFALSPSLPSFHRSPSLRTRLTCRALAPAFKFDPIRISASSKLPSSSDAVSGLSGSALPCRSWSLSSSKLRPWSGVQHFGSDPQPDRFEVRAASVPETAGEGEKSGSLMKTLQLGMLFGLWYLFNIYFNIYNKQVLKAFHYPATVTLVQFAVGSVLVLFMWITNLYKRPKVSRSQLMAIVPLAVVHTLGNLFTNMSLGKVAVSFTHTIKAMEPFFSVVLSVMFLGEMPTPWVVGSLIPIVGGVALASVTEASFNCNNSSIAIYTFVYSVSSLHTVGSWQESIDNITLFSIITMMSFILLFPVTCYLEGVKFSPAYFKLAAEQGMNVKQVLTRSLVAALCFHAYQQVSYMILQRVSPVTHSVGNCVKRVVVIVSSVIFFQTPVSPINSLGTGIALAGVFLYSRVKRIKTKPKTA